MRAAGERFGLDACVLAAVCAVSLLPWPARAQPPSDFAPPPDVSVDTPPGGVVGPVESPVDLVEPDEPPPTGDVTPVGELPPAPPFAAPPIPAGAAAADGPASVVVPEADVAPAQPPARRAPEQRGPPAAAPVDPPALRLLEESLVAPPTAFEPTRSGTPAGRPVPLLEALERSGDRSRRLWITQAYWKLAAAHGRMRFAALALERFELVAPGGDPYDRLALDVATAAARADLAETQAEFGVAQQELSDLVRLPQVEPLPWPADRPLVGPYETHYDAIFAARVATGRVRAIVRTLPARHAAIDARAEAVGAARNALELVEADHAKGQRSIDAVLAAHAALAAQERGFVDGVRVYNLEIAEYAMAVADLSVPDDRFVSMLIGAPIQWRQQPAAATSGGIAPADPVTN